MVGALVFQLFVAIAPASATVVTMTDTDSLKFNRTNGYTNIVGTGTSAGDVVLYKNVGTFGGVAVDAVITTVSINGSISNYDNIGNASANADYFQVNTTGGDVTMKFSFYEAGTFTGANTGIPVIIQNLRATAIDLDSSSTGATYQYTEFTGFQKYSLTSPTNLAVQPLTNPNRVRFVATKTGMRTSVPEDQVLVRYDAAQSFSITMGNVSTGQTNYFGLAFGPWPGTGTPVEYSNAFNTPPTSTDTSLYYASGVPTVLPLSAFGTFADADGNTFFAVRIASLPASGSLEYFNGTAWVPVTLNQVIGTSDIGIGELRYTGTLSTSFTFAVSDALDYSVVNYTLSLLVSGATQTITFPNPGTQTSGTTIDSQATSDSGESVTLTSLTPGVCSVDNVTMKITTLANGTCSIVASQAGNANYAAATSVTQTFMVSGDAAQTITFTKPADTTTAYSPVVSGATASSGLTVTLASLTTSVCSIDSVNRLNILLLSPGTCTIRATQPGGTNGGTTYAAASPVERSFLVTVGPPTARTDTATGIASTSATLNGSVTGFGASTTVQFCLSTTSTTSGGAMTACTVGSGRVTATPGSITAAGATAVSYAATSLTTGSTYYFQVIATSASGTTYGAVRSFTPAAVYLPAATTMPVTALSSSTTATLAGVVSANGAATTTAFCWNSTSPAVNAAGRLSSCTALTGTAVAANGVNASVSANITSGLASGKTYYYQISATNSAGTVYGAVLKFVARGSVTQTTAATSITSSGATLNGSVNTGSTSRTSTVTFCLSKSDANTVGVLNTCTQTLPYGSTVTGTSAVNVSVAATGLASSTTYYFQVKTVSSRGAAYINYGAILSFTTSATAPTVQTLAAGSVLATSATLSGEVNPNLGNAIAKFCYGTSPTLAGCTTETATPGAISGGSTVGVSLVLGNLNSLTTYYFRVSATNATGTTNGSILSFTTGGPVAITTAATGVSGSAARLNGAVKAQGAAAVNNAFCYGTLESVTAGKLNSCTTVAGIDPTSTGYSATPVYASITGLTGGNTYFFQTVASRTVSGTTYYAYGDVLSFVAADVPIVTTVAVTGQGSDTATLRGTLTANGAITTGSFCYSTSGATADGQVLDACTFAANWVSANQAALAANQSNITITGDATGLRPGTTYYYQAVGENSRGTVYGTIRSFTTAASAPAATTLAAIAGTSSAVLNGTINPNGGTTTVSFCTNTTGSSSTNANNQVVLSSCTTRPATPETVTGTSLIAETATWTGLTAGNTYYYQIVGVNSAGTTYGAIMTVVVGAPTVTTQAASNVTSTTARLNGLVASNGSNVISISFCWGLVADNTCTTVTATPSTSTSATDTPTLANITGLTPGNVYWFQVVAQNGRGTSYGNWMSFTAGAPTVVTSAATNKTPTGATLNGTVNANNGDAATPYFCYSTSITDTGDLADCTLASAGSDITGATTTAISAVLTGLLPGTIYYFQANGDTNLIAVSGQVLSFTTPVDTPTVTTSAATAVTSTGATLNANVNPGGASTTISFCYGTASNLAGCTTVAADQSPASGTDDVWSTKTLTGLIPGTTYYFTVRATNSAAGPISGSILSFTTPAIAPTATTDTATAISQTGATLNGTVNAGGATTSVTFCYGTAANLAGCTLVNATPSSISGNSNLPESYTVTGLSPSTTYYFRVSATNSAGGPIDGSIRSFTTSALVMQTITFNANGGSPATDSQTVVNNVQTALKSNPFSRTGYHFTGWDTSVAGTTVVYANGANVTLVANLSLYAVWAIDTFTLASSAGAHGSITSTITTTYGATETFTVTASAGYHVDTFTVDGSAASLTNGKYVFSNVNANHTISVGFAIDTFTLTSTAGPNGAITSTINTTYGATETFTVTADSGYHVASILIDGSPAALTGGKYVFSNVTASHTINATFAIDTFTLTSSAGAHGSITSTINTTYGATETFTVTPAAGYHVDTFTVDGSPATLTAGKYVFSSVTANHTISVSFAIDAFTLTSTAGAHGSITSTINTTYGATETFTVTADLGYHVETLTVDGNPATLTAGKYVFGSVSANHAIAVTFAIDTFTLTSSAGAHGSITSTINTTYGATETFTVTVDPGYHVETLTVDGSPATLTDGKYVFTTVTANHAIVATFAIDAFTLTSTAGAHGSITSTINTTYGATETFTVSVDPGYHVETLTVDGSPAVLTNGQFVFSNVTANHAINATFAIDTFTLTSSAGAHGSITSTINTTYGATETFTVTPAAGYHVETLTVDGNTVTLTNGKYVFASVTANHTIAVTFAIDTFTVTTSAGAHGSITASVDTTYGATETITVTADTGYHVATVTVDGNPATLSAGKYVVSNITADHTISATFAIDTFTVTASAGANGTITQSGDVTVNYGATETFTVTAGPGYHVDSVLVDSNPATLSAGKYVFTNITANHTIAVTFAIDTFTLTSSAGAHGAITSTINTTYGATESFTVTIDPGYHVETLTVDGNTATLTAGKYVFANVTANHTITITFAIDAFTLTSSAGAHGSITPTINTTYGATETFTVTADLGYHVETLTVDGNPATLTAGKYVFTGIAANHTISVAFAIDTFTVTTSAGAHGSITSTVNTSYGATETITVTANTGYHVETLTVDGSPANLTAGKYVFTNITANHSISVAFAIDTFTVSTSAGTHGSITASIDTTYGATETVTVTANTGYHVASVTVDDGPATLTAGKYVFTNITANHTISVTFAIDTFTVSTSAGTHGSITASIDTTYGATETVTVTADTGYHVATVTVDSNPATLTAGKYVFPSITANHTISVTFAIDTYTVTASAGSNGSIAASGAVTVNHGSTETFTVTANTGYHVDTVTVDGSPATLTNGKYVFVDVTGAHTIDVTFAIDTFTVTTTAGAHGSITASIDTTYGATETITVTANTGYHVATVTVDGSAATLTAGQYVFSDITANHTIAVTFAVDTHTVTYSANGGSGSMSNSTVNYGEPTALPSSNFTRTGHHFAGWALSANGTLAYRNAETVTITSDIELFALWEADTYTLTFAGNGGSGSMADLVFTYGVSESLTANTFTRSGYSFAGWALSADGSVVYSDAQSVTPATSITLYAVWNAIAAPPAPQPPAPQPPAFDPKSLKFDTQTVVATTPGSGPIGGLPTGALIQVSPTLLPKTPGIALASYADGKITYTAAPGFSGKTYIPLEIISNGVTTVVFIPVFVNPAPSSGTYTPQTAARTTITWAPSPNAIGYVVDINGKVVCNTTTTSCDLAKLIGPATKLVLTALGNDGTKATSTLPAYAPEHPVEISVVRFAPNSAKLNPLGKQMLDKLVTLLKAQGFTRLVIRGYTDSQGGTKNAAALSTLRAKAVAKYLRKFIKVGVITAGKGVQDPAAPNTTATGQSLNRRALVLVW